MLMSKTAPKAERALAVLPPRISDEIRRICSSRTGGISEIREICLRRGARSSVTLGDECLTLFAPVGEREMRDTFASLEGGALYAHRESIASGYVSLGGGVRVGVCGHARYDGQRLVGVGEVSSLVFRIPTGKCDFADELYRAYLGAGGGMLIYSPPGVGKTTAIRSLAGSIGSGRDGKRVAVIDERCELMPEDYHGASVDILSGYRRAEGIEIATRTMSPDVIMIDEIGEGDAEPISRVLRCGIPVVATAHAANLDELFSRVSLAPLLSLGAFSRFVGISKSHRTYTLTLDDR